jgi:hydroxyethylthiazole kinase
MRITVETVWECYQNVRYVNPLVYSITNSVVQNFTANALLAVGASPLMSDAVEEVAELVAISNAINLNIGTPTPRGIDAMQLALRTANARSIPVALDPVAAGVTELRRESIVRLFAAGRPLVIRGNASELAFLAGTQSVAKGVDADPHQTGNIEAVRAVSAKHACIAVASGEVDFVAAGNGRFVWSVQNGHPLMARITGSGCVATAIVAAFVGANPDPVLATIAAMSLNGVVGELAADHSRTDGPGSFQVQYLDLLQRLDFEHLEARMQVRLEVGESQE